MTVTPELELSWLYCNHRPPDPMVCERCGKPRRRRPIDERCCNWRGQYLGRHRKRRRG